MRIATVVFVLGLAVSLAGAAPVVTASHVDAGGMYGVTISVDDGTAIGSWAQNLTFTALDGGTINQLKAFVTIVVDKEADANVYDPLFPGSGYQKAQDSWAYTPFAGIGPLPQFDETATTYYVHAGTPAGDDQGALDLSYVVLAGSARLQYEGTVSRGGQDYVVSGIYEIPEPATMGLLALGGVAMLLKRRR